MFLIGGVGKTGLDLFFGQFRIVVHNVLPGHSRGEPAQYVIDRDPAVFDAGPSKSNVGVDRDLLMVIFHAFAVPPKIRSVVQRFTGWRSKNEKGVRFHSGPRSGILAQLPSVGFNKGRRHSLWVDRGCSGMRGISDADSVPVLCLNASIATDLGCRWHPFRDLKLSDPDQ